MENIIKIGNVELTESQISQLYTSNRYIVTYSKIYSIEYSMAQKKFYGRPIYTCKGMAKRGRFHALTASEINHMLDFPLLNT